jgi:hypothetical protein
MLHRLRGSCKTTTTRRHSQMRPTFPTSKSPETNPHASQSSRTLPIHLYTSRNIIPCAKQRTAPATSIDTNSRSSSQVHRPLPFSPFQPSSCKSFPAPATSSGLFFYLVSISPSSSPRSSRWVFIAPNQSLSFLILDRKPRRPNNTFTQQTTDSRSARLPPASVHHDLPPAHPRSKPRSSCTSSRRTRPSITRA